MGKQIARYRRKYRKFSNAVHLALLNPRQALVLNVFMDLWGKRVKHCNFGDDLNYHLINELTTQSIFNYPNLSGFARRGRENVVAIGSIAERATNKDSIVWGSGAIMGGNTPIKEKPKAVKAVRGPLTRQWLMEQGIDCPEVYGDPALLLPYVYAPQVKKKYRLGIVPHYVDLDNPYVGKAAEADGVKLINLRQYRDWHDIIDSMNECEFIISSSLHGLIVADAYGIPNMRVKFSDKLEGGDFKFRDYQASTKRPYTPPLEITSAINVGDILAHMKDYVPIRFDCRPLAEACPFPLRREVLDRIYGREGKAPGR